MRRTNDHSHTAGVCVRRREHETGRNGGADQKHKDDDETDDAHESCLVAFGTNREESGPRQSANHHPPGKAGDRVAVWSQSGKPSKSRISRTLSVRQRPIPPESTRRQIGDQRPQVTHASARSLDRRHTKSFGRASHLQWPDVRGYSASCTACSKAAGRSHPTPAHWDFTTRSVRCHAVLQTRSNPRFSFAQKIERSKNWKNLKY